MQGFNFTERVRKVLAMAREESARLHHEYVGTEHILLGLIREGEGVASTVLQNLSVDAGQLRNKLEAIIKKGRAAQTTGPDLPYTTRAKMVLELSMKAAVELKHSYVGTEHLLLGLLDEQKGIAAQVLMEAGLTLDAARAETRRILGAEQMVAQIETRGLPSVGPLVRHTLTSVVVELRYDDGWRRRREFPTATDAMTFLAGQR